MNNNISTNFSMSQQREMQISILSIKIIKNYFNCLS